MIFNSLHYYIFFAVILAFLGLVKNGTVQKWGLLLGSYYFYAQWDWRFMGLLFGLSSFTFVCTRRMRLAPDAKGKKLWLALQVAGSLVVLGWFKYANFFLDTIRPALQGMNVSAGALDIILPVGISFIVFEVISYAVDTYRGDTPYEESFLDFSLLVAFFPHLIAGPIIKPKSFLPQLNHPTKIKANNLSSGSQLFLWGLIKKVLVADRVAPFADTVFHHPTAFDSWVTWLGLIAYAVQIYCDFSGYTDMAIGSARMMGYDIPRNFDLPYLAQNITVFWRKWHISLSTWLREYLYIPLGGNRKGLTRTYINLIIVMLLGGLWHGASWNFVLWGGIHGVGLAIHKFWTDRKIVSPELGKKLAWASWLLTFLFAIIAWVPFRSTDWNTTTAMLGWLANPFAKGYMEWISVSLIIAAPALLIADIGAYNWHHGRRLHLSKFSHQLAFCCLALATVVCAPPAGSPFIYFQF